MITQILLALDASPSSREAQNLALALAARHRACVNAVALVDVATILQPMPTGIGGAAFQAKADAAVLRRAMAESQEARAELAAAAGAAGVECVMSLSEETPEAALAGAAVTADLVVLGREASFTGIRDEGEVSDAALALLAYPQRPLLLVPAEPAPADGPILAAFDGSAPSSRALHMLALLGLVRDREVQVVSIAREPDEAGSLVAAASALLRAHGAIRVEGLPLASSGDPARLITEHAKAVGASMVAMGAYGHNGIKELFFGSTTRHLLNLCPVPLFVFH